MPSPRRTGGPAWIRIGVAATVGVATGVATAVAGRVSTGLPVGWVAGAAVLLALNWRAIRGMDAEATATHATREDPSRRAAEVLLLVASVASLGAIGMLLARTRSSDPTAQDLAAALAATTVAVSWLVVHTQFTLRYARLYYTAPEGGIDFNQEPRPRYADFAYLAFTIGMTYQVSDTNLRKPEIRATALRHGLLSFLLGAVVLGTTVNLVASLAS